MKKLIILFLLAFTFVNAQIELDGGIKKDISLFRLLNGNVYPTGAYHVLPYANNLYNFGASGTIWNYGYFDTTVTNHLANTTWTLNSVAVTSTGTQLNYLAGATGTTGTTTTNLVFSTSPVLVTPTLGVAIGTSLALGGATIGTNALAVTGNSFTSGYGVYGATSIDADILNDGTPQFSTVANQSQINDVLARTGNGVNGALLWGYKTRSTTTDGNTIVQNNDQLLEITAFGANGTLYTRSSKISFEVDGVPGAADMPGRIIFLTTPDGSASITERARINNAGELLINTTTDAGDYKLQVAGNQFLAGNLTLNNGLTPTSITLYSKDATGTNDRYTLNGWGSGADSLKFSIAQTYNGGSAQGSFNATGFSTYDFDNNVKTTGGIFPRYLSGALTDGAPTDAEIDGITSSTPAGLGAGYMFLIKDTDGSGLIYEIISDGTAWQYKVLTIAL